MASDRPPPPTAASAAMARATAPPPGAEQAAVVAGLVIARPAGSPPSRGESTQPDEQQCPGLQLGHGRDVQQFAPAGTVAVVGDIERAVGADQQAGWLDQPVAVHERAAAVGADAPERAGVTRVEQAVAIELEHVEVAVGTERQVCDLRESGRDDDVGAARIEAVDARSAWHEWTPCQFSDEDAAIGADGHAGRHWFGRKRPPEAARREGGDGADAAVGADARHRVAASVAHQHAARDRRQVPGAVGKDELMTHVWPGVVVTDDSLTRCISEIRAAIGDRSQQAVKTVARRGYLFVAPVVTGDPAPPLPAARIDAGRGVKTEPPLRGWRARLRAFGRAWPCSSPPLPCSGEPRHPSRSHQRGCPSSSCPSPARTGPARPATSCPRPSPRR